MPLAERIVIVDDERLTRETLVESLRDQGYDASAFASAYEALELLEEHSVEVVLTDLRMPSMDGAEFHRRIKDSWPETEVIFMTAYGTVASAVEAMRDGAADYLTKPLNTEELLIRLKRIIERQQERQEINRLRIEAAGRSSFGDLVHRSAAMRQVVDRALAIADSDIAVLVQGATGTGKEVLARAIHANSPRATGPFVAVNAAGLNPNLVESELFGHEVGAFTGASRQRKGRLEIADGGTLFVDEVDDLGPEIQVRLLRFLQERTFDRVGSSRTLKSDVRVLCATKRSLQGLVEKGSFREDLFYRINSAVIELPPLAERREDILLLAEHFRREGSGANGRNGESRFSPEVVQALLSHDWPGNVRELQHVIEHTLAFTRGDEIKLEHLPQNLLSAAPVSHIELHLPDSGPVSLTDLVHDCEHLAIEWALARAGGNQVQAADLLSIPRTTLRSRLDALRTDASAQSDTPDSD